jgi:[ribosomal protein S5]-alanine N-acetyltransferase
LFNQLDTPRLRLISLSAAQLQRCLNNLDILGKELAIPISSQVIDPIVVRAINMKLEKMENVSVAEHDWFTYWLIVIKEPPFGIGLAGFKGSPDANGEAEIGYGIDEAYWNRGYMTEAAGALCDWALSHPECTAVVANTVKNPASDRVLEKLGGHIYKQNSESHSWKINRSSTTL